MTPENKSATNGRVLVVYYSWGGNTRHVAEKIAQITGAYLLEVKAKKPYSSEYKVCCDEARPECRAMAKREIIPTGIDLSGFSTVFVGSPNWCGTVAPPVRTFLSSENWSGKTVIPFSTNGGGGLQRCEIDVRKLCVGASFVNANTFPDKNICSCDASIASWAIEALNQ